MRVSREEAARSRERILEVAGRLFRERGLDGIGVADLMRAAGMTHGGFYGHFGSKSELEAEACERVIDGSRRTWQNLTSMDPADPLGPLLERYLSGDHRDDVSRGCIYAALAADVARQESPRLRRAFTEGLRSSVEMLMGLVPGRSKAVRRKRALARLSAMVGALILARAVDDPELSNEVLDATRDALGGSRHQVTNRDGPAPAG